MFLVFDPRTTGQDDAGSTGGVPSHGADGPGHMAFAVAPDELDGWRRRLAEHGVALERDLAWPRGGRSLYFRDPAGNSIELATPRLWGLDSATK
jgi:catechol 2,3-dioxygenase-like lactoylglutathione lyase family enzyme